MEQDWGFARGHIPEETFPDVIAERLLSWQWSVMAGMHGSGCQKSSKFIRCDFLADATIHQTYQLIILIYLSTISYSVFCH